MIDWTLQCGKIHSYPPDFLTYFPVEITSYCEGAAKDINMVDIAHSSLGTFSLLLIVILELLVKIKLATETSVNGL